MPKKHLKRLTAPKTWDIQRKTTKYIVRPMPGKHPFYYSLSINEALKMMGLAETRKDVVNILKHNEVLIDNKKIYEVKYNVGLMDVLSIKNEKMYYRFSLSERGLIHAVEIPEKESTLKLCKVFGKKIVKEGKFQIRFHDGRTLLLSQEEGKKIMVGDSIVLDLTNNTIKEHIKMAPKTKILLINGGNVGKIGVIKSIKGDIVSFESDKEKHLSVKKNVFPLGSIKIR